MREGFFAPKKQATSVSSNLKKAVWDLYVGIGVQESTCVLCGLNKITNNVNSGFECAHIVARNFLTEDLSVYYLFPSCAACNNQCRDLCIFDFLYCRQRIVQLRRAILAIYKRYLVEHTHELRREDRMAPTILNHLYGPERFPAGGGIQNRQSIYEIARTEQYQYLIEQSAEVEKKACDIQGDRRFLMEMEIKTSYLV
jgi:hypothetical protein